MEKTRCAEKIFRGWQTYCCHSAGIIEHEGKMYCKRHHPPTKAARDAERHTVADQKYKEKSRQRLREFHALQLMIALRKMLDHCSCTDGQCKVCGEARELLDKLK